MSIMYWVEYIISYNNIDRKVQCSVVAMAVNTIRNHHYQWVVSIEHKERERERERCAGQYKKKRKQTKQIRQKRCKHIHEHIHTHS